MRFILFYLFLFYSTSSFSWSILDKLQYDSYRSCLDHKLKDVDRTKTDINAARRAFEADCKKAFCSKKEPASDEEFESCVKDSVRLCEGINSTRKRDYEEKLRKNEELIRKRKVASQRAELAEQKKRECLADLSASSHDRSSANRYKSVDEYICSDPSAGFYNNDLNNDGENEELQRPSYSNCDFSSYYDSCRKDRYVDKTCR